MNGKDIQGSLETALSIFPGDEQTLVDVGMTYEEFMEKLPSMDIPSSYIDRYSARGGAKVVALSAYAIRDFCSRLAIGIEKDSLKIVEENKDMIRVQSMAVNRRYGIFHYGVREQFKAYPPKKNEKTGEMEARPIPNYAEITYVTSQRNAMKGLLPEKAIIEVIEMSKINKSKQQDKYVIAAKRIEDASKAVRSAILENSKELEVLEIDDVCIFNVAKGIFGEDVNDWGAGQYKQLEQMIRNPTELGLTEKDSEEDEREEHVESEEGGDVEEILNQADVDIIEETQDLGPSEM